MLRKPYLEWMKTSFDQRFNEMARIAGKEQEVEPLRRKRNELETRLKNEITFEQFQLILEWEDTLNYRHTLEKELLYQAGFKDGMGMLKQIQEFMSG